MDALLSFGGGVVGLSILVFLVVLALMWFLLPIAVFSIKNRLAALDTFGKELEKIQATSGSLLIEQRRTNELLGRLGRDLHPIESEVDAAPLSPLPSAPPPLVKPTPVIVEAWEDPVDKWEREQQAANPKLAPSGLLMEFSCPQCGGGLEVDSAAAGQKVKCPDCGEIITIPLNGAE